MKPPQATKAPMRQILEFILKTRWHTLGIALLFTVLSMLEIPLVGWISIAILALITLQQGPKAGFILLLILIIPYTILLGFNYHNPLLRNAIFLDIGVDKIGTYCAALYIRRTGSWEKLIMFLTGIGLVIVGLMHQFIPNLSLVWNNLLLKLLLPSFTNLNVPNPKFELNQLIHSLTPFASGIAAALIIITLLSYLMLGRAMQAYLYQPGAFRAEITKIYIPRPFLIICLLVGILPMLHIEWVKDLYFLVALPLFLVGLVTMNYFIRKTKTPFVWFIICYAVLLLIPIIGITLVIILAIVDSLYHLRLKKSNI